MKIIIEVEIKIRYRDLNPTQKALFLRVLHGLEYYPEEELKVMSQAKKWRIQKVHRRAQSEIARWKHRICYRLSNSVFSIFQNSPLALAIAEADIEVEELSEEIAMIPFRKLGISYDHIIAFFLKEGLLPPDFERYVSETEK